jgi:tripartite-type tricarboxylate transporter receptor subunit TctC
VGISENRKSKAEAPPKPSQSRRTQRRRVETAMLLGHPFRVNATELLRRQFMHLVTGAAALPAVSRVAKAQSYPTRPITIVVPFAAGGGADVIGRIISERMRVSLGRPVVIENVTGANGSIGVGRVARAASDGYTLTAGSWSTFVANGAAYALPYNILTDFEPIALVASQADLIVAKKAMPANDLEGLIAWLKANPDKASAGTNGVGSAAHFAAISFQRETDTRFAFVPYRGGALAMQDLVAGQIDLIFATVSDSIEQLRAGTIKAYAVTAKNRSAAASNIPTVDEAGLPGFHFLNWHALFAPKGTPKSVIGKLNAAVMDALVDPAVRSRLADFGQEIFPREQQTPEALSAFHKAEIEKWWSIIKAANIKGE